MKPKTPGLIIESDTPITWEYLNTLEDFSDIFDFLTPRQRSLIMLADMSDSILIQMLITDGFKTKASESQQFTTIDYAAWLDAYFPDMSDEDLASCAVAAYTQRQAE